MDEIKKQLKVVMVYQFWILSGIVLLASGIIFYMTHSSLTEMIDTRTKKIESKYTELTGVKNSVPTHPNAFSHKEMDQVYQSLKVDVRQAWETQYSQQIPLLVWPKVFKFEETWEIFNQARPIEKMVDFPINPATLGKFAKVTVNDRKVYRDYIGPEFKRVAEIIGTKWKAKLEAASQQPNFAGLGSSSMGGAPGMNANAPVADPDEIVRWAEASQQKLLGQVLPWYNQPDPPSVLDIYYAQEDLWLMTALMEIIKETNAGAMDNSQTIVREIEWIRMGKAANLYAGALNAGEATGGGQSPYGGGGGPGADYKPGGGMPSGYSMGGGKTEGNKGGALAASKAVPDPAEDRYVTFATGAEFKPRKAAELRSSMKNLTTANAVDAIAKRVPIRLRLKVDPGKVNKLITACGNAKMMLEVYQLRWNTAPAEEGSGSGGGAGGAEGGGSKPTASSGGGSSTASDGGIGVPSGMGGFGAAGSGASSAIVLKPESEVTIEIFGLMYFYNPVNDQVLAADKLAVATATPAVAPTTPAVGNAQPGTAAQAIPAPADAAKPGTNPATPATAPTVPPTTVAPTVPNPAPVDPMDEQPAAPPVPPEDN